MWEEKWSCNGQSRALFYRELPPETKKLGRVFLRRAINLVQAKNSGRIIISMQPMRTSSLVIWCVKGPPLFFLWVGGGDGRGGSFLFSSLWCRLDCPLFTFHLGSGQSTFRASIFFIFYFRRGEVGQSKEFGIAPQNLSHMLWQMLSSFHLRS